MKIYKRSKTIVEDPSWWPFTLVDDLVEDLVENIADVTLIDKDTKSILTDEANITDNMTMQVTLPGGKILTNASGAIWWPYFQLMQLAPPGGQISN